MTARCTLATLLILPSALLGGEDSAIPKAFPAGRYEKIKKESPFVLATPPKAPEKGDEQNWSDAYYLSGVANLTENGVDVPWVSVRAKSSAENEGFVLKGFDDVHEGIRLVKVEWASDPKLIKAVVKKGNEPGVFEPNQADFEIRAPAPPNAPGNAVANARGLIRRPSTGTPSQVVVPRPRTNFVPTPPTANQQNAAGPKPASPNDRRRIRVIPARPSG